MIRLRLVGSFAAVLALSIVCFGPAQALFGMKVTGIPGIPNPVDPKTYDPRTYTDPNYWKQYLPGQLPIPPELAKELNICKGVDEARKASLAVRQGIFDLLPKSAIPETVILLDAKTPASFTYNAMAGTADYNVTLPGGVDVDKSRIKASFSGQFSIPTVDPKALVSQMGFAKIVSTSGYDNWARAETGSVKSRVYVSSRRFVDSISDNRLAQEVGWAVLTAGQTAKGSVEALKEQLILEWADITAWLTRAGEDEAAGSALKTVTELLEISKQFADNPSSFNPRLLTRSLKFPKFDLDIKFDKIEYQNDISSPLGIELAKLLSRIGINGRLFEKSIRVPEMHLGFSISIKSERAVDYTALLKSLVGFIQAGPQSVVSDWISKAGGTGEFNFAGSNAIKDISGNDVIRTALKEVFTTSTNENSAKAVRQGVFDLTNASGVRKLEEKLRGLAVGNLGTASLKSLLVDTVSSSVTLDVVLHHRIGLKKKDILDALSGALAQGDIGFGIAKQGCKQAAKLCRNDIARALDLCRGIVQPDDLPATPPEIQAILASAGETPIVQVAVPESPALPKKGSSANPPQSYNVEAEVVGLRLPAWCFVQHQRYNFEITMDHMVRGLAVPMEGSVKRNNNGNLTVEIRKPIDVGPVDLEFLKFRERLSGTIQANGALAVEDYDKYKYTGRCRSVS